MRVSYGRAFFFDTIANGLLQLLPTIPDSIAISFKNSGNLIDYSDRVSIAESLYRLCKSSTSYISLKKIEDFLNIDLDHPYIIDGCGKSTQEIFKKLDTIPNLNQGTIIFNYSENNSPNLVEILFDINSEKYLVEEATRELFRKAKIDYEPLALYRYINGGFSVFHSQFSLFDEEPQSNFSHDPKRLEMLCHNIARNWAFGGKQISGDEVHNWVLQFKKDNFLNEACHLLLYLKREGFVTLHAVQENIRKVLNNHKKKANQIFIAIQPLGKSESLLSYSLRPQINLKSIEEALGLIKKNAEFYEFICFDDVIVSGGSMLKYLFNPKYNNQSSYLIDALKIKKVVITIISSHADINGIEKITSDPRAFGAVEIKSEKIIDNKHRVFSLDSNILPDKNQINSFKIFCKEIGKKLCPRIPLGWDNAEWCVVLDYTVPNGTLPILWASFEKIGWQCLFKRERTISSQKKKRSK